MAFGHDHNMNIINTAILQLKEGQICKVRNISSGSNLLSSSNKPQNIELVEYN